MPPPSARMEKKTFLRASPQRFVATSPFFFGATPPSHIPRLEIGASIRDQGATRWSSNCRWGHDVPDA